MTNRNKKLRTYDSAALRLVPSIPQLPPLAPERFWRVDDQRTGSVIIVKARTVGAALNQFLGTCAENCLIAEARESDIENFGPDIEED